MTWIGLAFLTAVFESGKDAFGKKALQRSDDLVVACSWRLLALPFLLPLLLVRGMPPIADGFWPALWICGGLNVITAWAYVKAIGLSDLSLTVPMVSFTPLFLLITSPLILGEIPAPLPIAGIVLIVLGSYLLHFRPDRRGLLGPLRSLVAEPGPRWMLLVALLWSVTANVDKIGVRSSSPLFWALAVNGFVAGVMLPVVCWRLRRRQSPVKGNARFLLGVGFCGALTSLCQMTAISVAPVPQVIAIKRTSMLLSVLWGHCFFGEKDLRSRLGAAAVMLTGVVLILFSRA